VGDIVPRSKGDKFPVHSTQCLSVPIDCMRGHMNIETFSASLFVIVCTLVFNPSSGGQF
jgi:hypothetical protein